MSSTLRGGEAFDVLLKYSDGKREKKKRIIIACVVIGCLVLLGVGVGVLVKFFFLDNNPNLEDSLSEDLGSQENPVCKVVQFADWKLTPCSFLFVTLDGLKFHNCTDHKDFDGKFWCSTKVNPNTLIHISGQKFWGYCEEENCPNKWNGTVMSPRGNSVPIKFPDHK